MFFVLIICDVPIAYSVGKVSNHRGSGGVCLSCKDSEAIPMMVDKFEGIICFISWIEDVESFSVRMVFYPLDISFDVVWEIVFCSSCEFD
jgi:hypothetical protein